MKLLIDNDIYKCLIDNSFSRELKTLVDQVTSWKLEKSTVVTITIDDKHKNYPEQVKSIEKDVREIIKALKGIDYYEEIIISIKFEDLSKYKFFR